MENFKPQLLPNEPAGVAPNWEERLKNPEEWLASYKLDGARVEIAYDSPVLGRSLKKIKNVNIQKMGEVFKDKLGRFGGVIEAEFYSPGMNFSELMHFFKSEDVTSQKTYAKYAKLWHKSQGDENLGWPFPGRDLEWATTWHPSLKFYTFDYALESQLGKAERCDMLTEMVIDAECDFVIPPKQFKLTSVDMMYQMYDQAMINGQEGLVLIKANSPYKCGRYSLKSNQAYKAKDTNLEFDGKVIDVLEATVAREGSVKTINELGRSKTSQLKEDRVLSGISKGFLVQMEDGRELTVSLNGYNTEEKRMLLEEKNLYIGSWIRFTGMAPTKKGGCPRHSHFTKGNFRDEK